MIRTKSRRRHDAVVVVVARDEAPISRRRNRERNALLNNLLGLFRGQLAHFVVHFLQFREIDVAKDVRGVRALLFGRFLPTDEELQKLGHEEPRGHRHSLPQRLEVHVGRRNLDGSGRGRNEERRERGAQQELGPRLVGAEESERAVAVESDDFLLLQNFFNVQNQFPRRGALSPRFVRLEDNAALAFENQLETANARSNGLRHLHHDLVQI